MTLSVSVPTGIIDELQRRARQEDRSVSSIARRVLSIGLAHDVPDAPEVYTYATDEELMRVARAKADREAREAGDEAVIEHRVTAGVRYDYDDLDVVPARAGVRPIGG